MYRMPELIQTITKTTNIVHFDVSGVMVYLHERATVNVAFTCDDGNKLYRDVVLEGDDYTNWGNDDNYINEYIALNINSILSNNKV